MKLDLHTVAEEIVRQNIVLPTNEALRLIPLSAGTLEIRESHDGRSIHHSFIIRLRRPENGWPEAPASCQLKIGDATRSTTDGRLMPRHWGPHLMLLSGEASMREGAQALLDAEVRHVPFKPCDRPVDKASKKE